MARKRKSKKNKSNVHAIKESLQLTAKNQRIRPLTTIDTTLFKSITKQREIQFKDSDYSDIIIRVKCDNVASGGLSKPETLQVRNKEIPECSGITTSRCNQATGKIDDDDDEVILVNYDNDVICVEPNKFKEREQIIEVDDDSSIELLPVTIEIHSPASDCGTHNECTSTEKNSVDNISTIACTTSRVENRNAEISVITLSDSVASIPLPPVENRKAEMSMITLSDSATCTPVRSVGNRNAEKSVITLSDSTTCTPVRPVGNRNAEKSVITLSDSTTCTPVRPVGNRNTEINRIPLAQPATSTPIPPFRGSNMGMSAITVFESFSPPHRGGNTSTRTGNVKCNLCVTSTMQTSSYTCAECLTSGSTRGATNGQKGMYTYGGRVTGTSAPVDHFNVNTGIQIPYLPNTQGGSSGFFGPYNTMNDQYLPFHADIPLPQSDPTTLLPPNALNIFGFNFLNAGPVRTRGLRPIFIDGSNVAISHSNGKYFSVLGLKICIDYFRIRGHEVIAIVPLFRKRPDQNSNRPLLDELEKQGLVKFTPSRKINGKNIVPYDDRYIILLAHVYKGIIVSSDNYQDLVKENPTLMETLEYRILNPTWVKDMIMFPADPLGRHGPKLDEFLRFPD